MVWICIWEDIKIIMLYFNNKESCVQYLLGVYRNVFIVIFEMETWLIKLVAIKVKYV